LSPVGELQVGLIGYGTAARAVANGIAEGKAGPAHLAAVLVRHELVDVPAGTLATTDRSAFLGQPLDVVVELAGQEAVAQHGVAVLESGDDFLILSIGALADDTLMADLKSAAERGGSRILIPSGAIGALDALGSAAIGGLDEVTITTRKPVDALRTGTERDQLLADESDGPVLLFEGPARDAVRLYPANVNVAAAVSLAGVGFDRTFVRIYADPAVTRNTHDVSARGWFGELHFQIANIPTENPKTGRITALSTLKALRNLRSQCVLVG
jgi:aspartate dehydrogenase